MLRHISTSKDDYKLSSDSSASSSPFPTCFPSPPPSIASFASSISANSSFSSNSSTSSKSNDPSMPDNLELRFTKLSSRLENILVQDDCQQQSTKPPPIPPVRHKRLQKLLQENNSSKIENHGPKTSPIPAPRTSCNLILSVDSQSIDGVQPQQQWRSASPPLMKTPLTAVGQYWTYQRQKQLHKQSRLTSKSNIPEPLFKAPKITIKVYAQTLCQDVEYITLPIDNQTKSSQVVRMLLKKFRLRHRDPNLFYLTLERWIKKDGIPIKSVMILKNDACPALLQSCCSNPPHNDIRFTLLMKNGALVKIYCSDVVSDSLYKSLSLSTQTTVEETIELLMNCLNLHHNLGSDTSSQSRDSDTASLTSKSSRSSTADQFELIEVCEAANYRRVLRNDENLVEVHQSLVNDLDSINCNNYDMVSDKHSSLIGDSKISSSYLKAELIIKLVRKEEQQLKSFERLLKFNGQQHDADSSSDIAFKVSNYRFNHHNSCSIKPQGYPQMHHQHITQHFNHQQNNRLAHYNYRHYSQEQLIDDLDKLSLILDDDKEQISGGDDVCLDTNRLKQIKVKPGFTHAWSIGIDGNNNNLDVPSHKVVLNVGSPTANDTGDFISNKSSNNDDNDSHRICPVAPMKNSSNIFKKEIELYENISSSGKINDNHSCVVKQCDSNEDNNHTSTVTGNDNDLTSAITNNSRLLSTENLIPINQTNSNNMADLTSKGQAVTDKQISIAYEPDIYRLAMDELKLKQLGRAAPIARAYENLPDTTVATVSNPPVIVPRSLY